MAEAQVARVDGVKLSQISEASVRAGDCTAYRRRVPRDVNQTPSNQAVTGDRIRRFGSSFGRVRRGREGRRKRGRNTHGQARRDKWDMPGEYARNDNAGRS